MSHGNHLCYAAGCRQPECREAWAAYRRHLRARRFAEQHAGKPPDWVHPAASQRRLRALMRDGWSIGELQHRTGLCRSTLMRVLQGYEKRRNGRQRPRAVKLTRISLRTHQMIEQVSRELDGALPTNPVPNRTKANAKRKRYAPLFAWDDISDPREQPKGVAA